MCSYRLYNTNSVSHQSVGGQQDEIIDIELLVPDVDQSQLRKIPIIVSALMNDDALDSLILKNIFQEFAA